MWPSPGCFNSIKVRVKPLSSHVWLRIIMFQFHKGTSKTSSNSLSSSKFACFNSIKVRVKLFIDYLCSDPILCFNSIKVRVKLRHLELSVIFIKFQFHKGTSKTCRRTSLSSPLIPFPFHNGTSKTHLPADPVYISNGFIYIKVRVNPSCFLAGCMLHCSFHFSNYSQKPVMSHC